MEELKTAKAHKVLLANRKSANFSGVLDVLSFDVNEILLATEDTQQSEETVLETEQGMLLIKGNDLHVNRLSLEQGEVDVTGKIDGLTYSDVETYHKGGGESFLGRLFK